jgi:hypothetical protein
MLRDFNKNADARVSQLELLEGVEKFFAGKSADALPGIYFRSFLFLPSSYFLLYRLVEEQLCPTPGRVGF